MKYYLIVGEASGDLHASRLMRALKTKDSEAEFRFFGGDLMAAEGGTLVRHYKEIAYMGVVPVLMHLKTILKARQQCQNDITEWQPDCVILVDYAGFNLNIAKFLRDRKNANPTAKNPVVYYYISPKIWAWKEGRIKNFKRDVDEMFSILPFEVDFFEKRHQYPIHYVGNPTANEVAEFRSSYSETTAEFCTRHQLQGKPILALLAGSRMQEIKDNLPMMEKVSRHLASKYNIVLACAPSISEETYQKYLSGTAIIPLRNETYQILSHATVALVTSGTATLETACFNVPQVVMYKTPPPGKVARWVWDHLFKVKYISLVNLIANKFVVPEMMADTFDEEHIRRELDSILPDGSARKPMLDGYAMMMERLGQGNAPEEAAGIMVRLLREQC